MPQSFDLVVLGAGVIGVNTAYWAARNGLSVCLVDRQPAAGLETSFANGGQISVSHAEPWANPSAPLKVLKWLADGDAPLLFRPRFDLTQWFWIARFLRDCLPQRANRHTAEIVKLATESRSLIQQLRRDEHLEYDQRQRGIIHFYRDNREFEAAAKVAELMRRHGCDREIIDFDRLVEIEPAFEPNRNQIVGATYTADDESGDALKYTQALASTAEKRGVVVRFSSEVMRLLVADRGNAIQGVELRTPEGYVQLRSRDVIICMGSYSPMLSRRYGVRLNIYPTKGYSVTIPTEGSNLAPTASLTDDQYKLVYSNLGNRLRVAGTAELSGYDLHLNERRCRAILRNAQSLFPDAGQFEKATFWTGLRPTTPSNLPYVGRTHRPGLWLNTGHGTLGWTMGAGSGKRAADMLVDQNGPIVA